MQYEQVWEVTFQHPDRTRPRSRNLPLTGRRNQTHSVTMQTVAFHDSGPELLRLVVVVLVGLLRRETQHGRHADSQVIPMKEGILDDGPRKSSVLRFVRAGVGEAVIPVDASRPEIPASFARACSSLRDISSYFGSRDLFGGIRYSLK